MELSAGLSGGGCCCLCKHVARIEALVHVHYRYTRFLVAGYTDAKGSAAYNEDLSMRRARAVYNALIARGVSPDMIRYKGFGKRVALIPATASDLDREGDRKVVIETVTNAAVWNYLGK